MITDKSRCSEKHLPHRLKNARKMAGLSMEELVEKAGRIVTRQSISKYEKGLMRPSRRVLERLADAMDVRMDFFSPGKRMDLSHLQFRQKSKLSRKEEEALKARAVAYLEYYHELEDKLGMKKRFENPLNKAQAVSVPAMEKATLHLRQAWGLGLAPIFNLSGLLEEKGIKIFVTECPHDFDGLTAKNPECRVVILNKDRPLDRLRFTAAHELAHIFFDFHDDTEDKESLCHTFAGSFLLPGEALRNLLGKKRRKIMLWEWRNIKEIYGISMQAALYRAHELQIISHNYFHGLLAVLRRKKWDRVEPFAYNGKEEATRFKRLTAFALAEKLISDEEAGRLSSRFFNEADLQAF